MSEDQWEKSFESKLIAPIIPSYNTNRVVCSSGLETDAAMAPTVRHANPSRNIGAQSHAP
jgi:hypothetical protein